MCKLHFQHCCHIKDQPGAGIEGVCPQTWVPGLPRDTTVVKDPCGKILSLSQQISPQNTGKGLEGNVSQCNLEVQEDTSATTEVCSSTSGRGELSPEWKKTLLFWLPAWQHWAQKLQHGNSLFLWKPKGRHVHKSTNNNTYLCQEHRKDKSVNFLPLSLHSRFENLSYRIWGWRHSGDYFLGLRMNCSYFQKLSLNNPCGAL